MDHTPDNARIVVIGTGFLMTYLDKCIKLLAGENFSQNIVGISQSLATAQRKSVELGYPVTPQEHLSTLKRFNPDIIMFSPPPSAARELTESALQPYYQWAREQALPLPDLYAYPPNPSGSYYRGMLGADVNIVNLLPNMATVVGGRDISAESYSVTIFPAESLWPQANYDRLVRFLTPVGTLLEIPEKHSTDMLGGFVASHMIQECTLAVWEGLKQAGMSLSSGEIAGIMRACLLQRFDRRFSGALACSLSENEKLNHVLKDTLDAWIRGMTEFARTRGMSEELSDAVCVPQLDIFLQSVQCHTPEEIVYNNSCHATRGGLLERGLEFFAEDGQPLIREIFSGGLDAVTPAALESVSSASCRLSYEIWQRGLRLAGG